MGSCVSLSLKYGVPSTLDVVDALKEAINVIENRDTKPTKAIVILLNDEDCSYSTEYMLSRMKYSEAIALMRIVEARFVKKMGY